MERTPERGKALQCHIHPAGTLETYKYVVVCSRYQDKWLLSRHKKRDTWETQGGHIEPGETPMDAARRELYEESGAAEAEIIPVCDYYGYDSTGHANGMVFLALIHKLGELPESEMQETGLFDELPANLTYPKVTPRLMAEAEKILEKRSSQEDQKEQNIPSENESELMTRCFLPEDKPAVVGMLHTYFVDDLKKDWPRDVVERIAEFIVFQCSEGIIDVLLLCQKAQPVGFAICQVDAPDSDWCKREGWGLIREFYIEPRYRLSGKGRFLAGQTESLLREKQAEQVYLTTSGALAFWLRCGYRIESLDENEKMYTLIKRIG